MLFPPIPPALTVLFPIVGGGAILNELFPAGGGAMLNEEYEEGAGGGAIAGKLEKEDAVFVVGVDPHGFDVPAALLQSTPELLLYEGVVVGDTILFILYAGLDCCWGGAKDGLPIPGFAAVKAGNDELSVEKVLSGVIARFCDIGAERFVIGGGETGGVDHENAGAGEGLFDLGRLVDGREGRTVEDDADAEPFAQGSPPSISVPLEDACWSPRTSASKSVSPFPLLVSKPLVVLGPPKVMNSLRVVAAEPFAPSSCSLRVCSFSTRADVDLMRVM